MVGEGEQKPIAGERACACVVHACIPETPARAASERKQKRQIEARSTQQRRQIDPRSTRSCPCMDPQIDPTPTGGRRQIDPNSAGIGSLGQISDSYGTRPSNGSLGGDRCLGYMVGATCVCRRGRQGRALKSSDSRARRIRRSNSCGHVWPSTPACGIAFMGCWLTTTILTNSCWAGGPTSERSSSHSGVGSRRRCSAGSSTSVGGGRRSVALYRMSAMTVAHGLPEVRSPPNQGLKARSLTIYRFLAAEDPMFEVTVRSAGSRRGCENRLRARFGASNKILQKSEPSLRRAFEPCLQN